MRAHEIEFATFDDVTFSDLSPYQFGREVCDPGHAFGPARRAHYLFHYIIQGSGSLDTVNEDGSKNEYRLSAGEGFLIFPGQITTYVADFEDPWEYIWLEFDGSHVKSGLDQVGLCTQQPIYRSQDDALSKRMLEEMREMLTHRDESALQLVGRTYLVFDLLLRSVVPRHSTGANKLMDYYLDETMKLIQTHYPDDLSVEDMARHLGLNRSYFSKMFKSATGEAPQHYLLRYRMEKAADLLKLSALSVAEVGRAVGYPNQLNFSRAFKNIYHLSPRAWRTDQRAR